MSMGHYKIHSCRVTDLISYFTPYGIGAEIGVKSGNTSFAILEKTNIKKLYMIDPWVGNYSKLDKSSTQLLLNDCYNHVLTRSKEFNNRAHILKEYSINASKIVPNLDFVFIDGNHNYKYVMEDLCSWVPKVKSGGLVMGHDWVARGYPDVTRAVNIFCGQHPSVFIPPLTGKRKFNKKYTYFPATKYINKSREGNVWWNIKA